MNILDQLAEIKELVNEDKKFKYKNIVNFNCKDIEKELGYANNCHEIEGQLGCLLDVLGKVILQKYFYDIYGNKIDTNIDYINQDIIINAEELQWGEWAANDKPIYLKEHKKTWWLKEDKSE